MKKKLQKKLHAIFEKLRKKAKNGLRSKVLNLLKDLKHFT